MKILSGIFYALFVTLLLSIAGLFLASILPIPGKISVKIVKSGSMEPAIMTGSIVVIQPQHAYAIGDVITFGKDTTKDVPTSHRIIGVREENGVTYFSTKGDANKTPEPDETPQSKIIGKVLFSIPSVGYILDFARKPLGFSLLIGLPATLIVIDESMRIYTEIVALRQKRRLALQTPPRPRPRV